MLNLKQEQRYFNVKFPVFPTILNVGVELFIIYPNLHRDWKLGFWILL